MHKIVGVGVGAEGRWASSAWTDRSVTKSVRPIQKNKEKVKGVNP